jgi:hypothetical protein
MLDRIPEWLWALVAGAFLAAFVFAVTFGYLPSPRELFRDVAAECRQTGVHKDRKADDSQKSAHDGTATSQQPDPEKSEDKATRQKEINECLLAAYTGSLSDFTKWLVFVTCAVAAFGFWQVIETRGAAKRELRAYISVEPRGAGPAFSDANLIVAHIGICNTGAIFAKNVRTFVDLKISDDGDLKEQDYVALLNSSRRSR